MAVPSFTARRRAVLEAAALVLMAVLVAEAFAYALPPEAQPFHRAGFLLVLAAVLAAAWRGGLAGGLAAGLLGGLGIVHVFLAYGGPLGPPRVRATVGGTIALFALALALLIGRLRDRERVAVEALVRERAALAEKNRALEAANERLREANEALEAFSYVASHDLKEPVRALAALTEALEDDEGERLSTDGREVARRARHAARRLNGLVAGLLEVSRASRTDLSRLGPVSVRETLASEECVARFQDLLHERGGRLTVAEEHGTPPVLATHATMCLILGNLVLNAIRHNPRVAPAVLVRAAPAAGGEAVQVSVEDNGPGLDEEARERIDALSRGEAPPRPLGGFGLLIVARTTRRLGGSLWAGRSESLGGAAVRVTLPAGEAIEEALVTRGEARLPEGRGTTRS